MDNFVLLMAESGSNGIWNLDGSIMNMRNFPITKELKQAIKQWNRVFDNHDYLMNDEPLPEEFGTIGLSLAQLIKAELPEWQVKYYDENAALKYQDRYLNELDSGFKAKAEYTRTLFEYEIL